MRSLYRVKKIDPLSSGKFGALIGALGSSISVLIVLLLLAYEFLYYGIDGYSLTYYLDDLLYVAAPYVISIIFQIGGGFVILLVAALAYNWLNPYLGTIKIRLSE
ncbi:hypothetical protein ACFL2M_02535 [Patescibacteria group bacterium]